MNEKKPDRMAVLSMRTPGACGQPEDGLLYKNGDPDSGASVAAVKETVTLAVLGPDGKTETRQARYYLPKAAQGPCPLLISIHYEIPDGDRVLYEYLSQGWAVLTPVEIPMEHLMNIVGIDLRVSNALVSHARRNPRIDPLKIALRGCSAGGFQALLLAALRAGLCAVYSMSGVCNLPYEFGFYIPQSNEYNLRMEHTLTAEQRADFNNYRLPFVKTVADTFASSRRALGADNPLGEAWLRYSPVSHLKQITCPVLLSHSTADAIVPVYQVTEANAKPEPGAGMPEGYRLHLKEFTADPRACRPLDELVGPDALHTFFHDAPKGTEGTVLRFDGEKRFSLNLIDEGAVEPRDSHFKALMSGLVDDTPYFRTQFERGAEQNNAFTPEKLRLLAVCYRGGCALLTEENVARAGAKGSVYGSLASQQLDVLLDLLACLGRNPWMAAAEHDRQRPAGLQALQTAYEALPPEEWFLGAAEALWETLPAQAQRCAADCGEAALADRLGSMIPKSHE